MNSNSILQDIRKNDYLNKLLIKAENFVSHKFFNINKNNFELTKKEYIDLLKFGDILTHSLHPDQRNLAYKIVTLLKEDNRFEDIFKIYSTAILSKLGNFPGLINIKHQYQEISILPFEREIEKEYKMILQKVPNTEHIFTDAQYEIFQSLINSNHFSFSGPTSLGKSFIIQAFIKYITSIGETRENIVILVPTRALINQVSLELKKEYEGKSPYHIITYPKISYILNEPKNKFILVLTPERLISYLSERSNPKIGYLFIDEAHKILSEKDSRSPLYYHAIVQAERKSIKLFFASPNIPNPDIFLKLFELSTDESLYIEESPVTQNRYFLDLIKKEAKFIHADGSESKINIDIESDNFNYWLLKLGNFQKNIIYCNTIADTIQYALNFSKDLKEKDHKELTEIIQLTEDHLHKDYYLIQCLKKGVAFHFGKLPQNIRQRIEKLFQSKVLDYVFCTSTLLEGVNLPAKNIFILSNAMGLSKFEDIDFWNLAGRAGRLTKELSGNIICVRAEDKKNRWESDSDLNILKNTKIAIKKYPIDKSRKSIFENMEHSLKGENYTKKNPTSTEIDIWNHFANIALIHEKIDEQSILRSNFIEKVPDATKLLNKISQDIKVPIEILITSSSIKPIYQNKILQRSELEILPNHIDYETAHKFLLILSRYYNWQHEESHGHNPMIPKSDNILKYYATLMNQWMNGFPTSQIILSSIKWHSQNRSIWNSAIRNYEIFHPESHIHLNIVINDVIAKIEDILRFKLERYFQNYYLLVKEKYGNNESGSNWAEFLEYGTTNKKMIDIQNLGFPRHLAKHLLEKYSEYIKFENDNVIYISLVDIKEKNKKNNLLDKELFEYLE